MTATGMDSKLSQYSNLVRDMIESTGYAAAISNDLVRDPQDVKDFANVDISRSPMGVMAAANALDATIDWYTALCSKAPHGAVELDAGWQMLHYVMMAKDANMPIPEELFMAACHAAQRVEGRNAAKRSLELIEAARMYDKRHPLRFPGRLYIHTGIVARTLLRNALAEGEMADVERAIAIYKAARGVASMTPIEVIFSTACEPTHAEQALRMLVKYDASGVDESWYSFMWLACKVHKICAVDLFFVLRAVVDEFVVVRKHNTLAFLVKMLSRQEYADGFKRKLLQLLPALPGVEDADMYDAVGVLRLPTTTLDDLLPLLEWAETHKAAATAGHIVEIALKENDLEIMDRAIAVWRLGAPVKRRRVAQL